MSTFGIDFGTTNSVLAVCARGEVSTVSLNEPPAEWTALGFDKVLPSVLSLNGTTSQVGWSAKTSDQPKLAAVKRLFSSDDAVEIGDRYLKVEEAGALIFKHIQKRALAEGLTLDQAVVTIPANSRGRARSTTKVAAGLAGIEVVALVNEPTAAAMAYGRSINDGERVLVYDFGGGTFDVTVLQSIGGVFMEQASKGVQRLGGIDIDHAIAEHLKTQIPGSSTWERATHEAFLLEVELAKVRLSSGTTATVSVPGGQMIELSRDDLNRVASPLIEQSRGPIEQCLHDLGGNVQIDHVVLVGGTSKIPAVRDFVSQLLGVSPMSGVDPMTAVAEGASLAAAILAGEVDDYDFFVGTEHALGVIVVDPDTDRKRFSVLIARNNKLPADNTDSYVPAMDYQESVNLRVVEGDPEHPLEHEDNVVLKNWDVKLAEPRPRAEAGFDVTYKYDVDGILRVVVRDQKTNIILMDEELAFGAERKRELGDMRKTVEQMVTGVAAASESVAAPPKADGLDAESQMLVDRVVSKIIPFVDPDEEQRLNGIIADLQSSTPETLDECRRRLGAAMREHAYLL